MVDRPTTVRFATVEDEQAVFEFIIAMWRGLPIAPTIPIDYAKVMHAVQLATRQVTDRPSVAHIGVLYDDDHRLVASAGVLVDSWWWSSVPILTLKWFRVIPEARRFGYYRDLFQFLEWLREGYQKGVPHPVLLELVYDNAMGDLALVKRMDRLFARFGKRAGSVFLAGLPR